MSKTLWLCASCGWWEVEANHYGLAGIRSLYQDCLRHAILRRYNPAAIDLPVRSLRSELHKRPELVHEVAPRKMEELVQAVFRDFFDCEVELCGRSHDQGIDLVIVNADAPSLVQVKRRASPTAVEPVSSVRDFLGAVVLKGKGPAIFVTTADHFSRPATRAAGEAVMRELVTEFSLIDRPRFLAMLDIVGRKNEEPWRESMQQTVRWNQDDAEG